MSFSVVIPARFAANRLPGKALLDICGKPMIQHVYERVSCVPRIGSVLVATDDERIRAVVADFGGEAVLTSPDHQTGTDRIVEAIEGRDAEWVLNVQGDEPAIDGNDLSRLDSKIYPPQYLEFTSVSAYELLMKCLGLHGWESQTARQHASLIHAESHGPAEAERLAERDRW